MKERERLIKRKWIWLCLLLLLLCPLFSRAEVAYEGLTFTGNEEYIDLQDHVVRDFDAFMAFLDQMPNLKQVDMWQNKMTKDQCDMLAGRYPDMKWGWTMLIRLCENVYVDGIRVESDQRIMNSDGIDFDSCRHVRVGNSTFKTGDDCLILRAMRGSPEGSALCEDVVVSNCVLDSTCQTIRMGCPSDDTIRNALFKNIKAKGHNGIFFDYPTRYLRPTDEGYMNISDIVFDGYSGSFTGSALQIVVQDGVKIRGVRNIEFRNFDVTTTRPLRFIHNVDSPFENVRFSNVTVNGARQPDGPVTAECRPSRPLVREHKSWETKKDRSKFHLFVLAGQSNMSGRGEKSRESAST